MNNPLFTSDGIFHLFRWIHFMAGVVWIGHLYYFNFVQTPFFAETDAGTKSSVIRGLVPKALWWFRWGAAFTFFSGLIMLMYEGHRLGFGVYATSWGVWILVGSTLGSLMAANVWFIIWPNQKIVIASTQSAATGGQADPRAADAGARASVASRTNVLFSIPMLFLMGASRHLPFQISEEANFMGIFIALLILIGALQLNAIFGKMKGFLKTVPAVIHSGLLLTVVIYAAVVFIL